MPKSVSPPHRWRHSVRIMIDSGTAVEGYRAPQNTLVVTPAGVSPGKATLSTLTLNSPSVLAGSSLSGFVTLTAPAPAGGATINLGASANGAQIAPASVTVPAGSTSASFSTIPAPQVNAATWVVFQARDNTSGVSMARLFAIQPAPGPATLLAIGPSGQDVIGGSTGRASVGPRHAVAPAGGGTVTLSTDNPTYIHKFPRERDDPGRATARGEFCDRYESRCDPAHRWKYFCQCRRDHEIHFRRCESGSERATHSAKAHFQPEQRGGRK